MRVFFRHILLLCAVAVLAACHPTKFLSEDESLLRSVKVTSDNKRVSAGDYRMHVRQEPNARWFSLVKVPLALYSLSPADTTRRKGRFFRRIGEEPVVYDSTLTDYSRRSLEAAMFSKGFLKAKVSTEVETAKQKTDVAYHISTGEQYFVKSIAYSFDNDSLQREVENLPSKSFLYEGMPLDVSLLSEERSRIVGALQNRGYYRLNSEFVRFDVDTIAGSTLAELTLIFACPPGTSAQSAYRKYHYRNIDIYEDCLPGDSALSTRALAFKKSGRVDRARFHAAEAEKAAGGDYFAYNAQGKGRVRPSAYTSQIRLRTDSLFRESDMQYTYSGLNTLPIVNYSTIRLHEVEADSAALDADVLVSLGKPHSLSLELEGTNTNGDLGAAAAITYSNRNLFRGSENLSLKLRGAYEAITELEGYNDENYFEYSFEASMRFPSYRLPFARHILRNNLRTTAQARAMFDSQNRPEFHRRVLTAAWSYLLRPENHPGIRHNLNLLNVNYVFMPWISDTFEQEYLQGDDPRYAILRATYDNLFIVGTSYSFTFNSQQEAAGKGGAAGVSLPGQYRSGWQLRVSGELAGNLLYLISHITKPEKNEDGSYSLFHNTFSQYFKADIDYSRAIQIDDRNTLAYHAYFGIAIPYGNSTIIPFEKRFFAGGANSVRGWGVRTLGPGGYKGEDGKVDFINQTGNLKLDFSVEWRTHLFWKFDGAFFVDAGNIWNTRHYEDFEDAQFKFNKFYKQIAVAYGLGLRFNLDYFVLRFDAGMKAVNPAYDTTREHFPIYHPKFSRDFAFHFAVGLPF